MANDNKYTLPIGINPQEFFAGISAIDKGLEDLTTNVADANKGMQSAFKKSATDSEQLEKAIQGSADSAARLGKNAEVATKQTSTLLDTLNIKMRRLQSDLQGNQNIIERLQITREIKKTQTAIEAETAAIQKNIVAQKSLGAQLLAVRAQMQQLTLAGKAQSGEYAALQRKAVELAEAQKKVSKETQAASDKSSNAIGKTYGLLRQLANLIPGIGISGIFLLGYEAVVKMIGQLDLFKKKSEEVSEALKQGEKDAVAQSVSLDALYRATQNTTLSLEQRTRAVDELKKQYPAYFENIKTETILNGGAAQSYDTLKEAILATAKAKAIEGKITEIITEGLDEETRLRENLSEAQKKAAEEAGRTLTVTRKDQEGALIRQELSVKQSEEFRKSQVSLAAQVLKNFKDNQDKTTKALSDSLDQQEKVVLSHPPITGDPKTVKSNGEKVFNETQAQRKRIADLNKQFELLSAKEAEGELDRQIEKLEAQKRATEELLNIEENKINHKKELGKQLTELDRQELQAINKVRVQLEANLALDKSKATDDFVFKQASLVAKANIEIAESLGNLEEMEIQKLREGYNLKLIEYAKQYKELPEKLKQLQEAAAEAESKALMEIRAKYAKQEVDQAEQLQIASINIAFGFRDLPAKVEEAKQAQILQVQLFAAKKRLEALLQAGDAETEAAKEKAREAVAALEAELGKLSKGRKFNNIFDVVGLTGEGGLTPEQIGAIQVGVEEIMNAYRQITDALLQANQQQINSSSEKISAFDKEIDSLQSKFDKEKELSQKGFANNAEYYRKQLDLQKKAKDEEVKNRHDLFEKQKAIQRQQLILDTISQGSSLITASANVLEGFSTIPIVGVPLGLIAVGAMIAGFIASKIAAFNAINGQKESFGGGGTIDGKSHAEGGTKYIAADGSGRVKELESGEEVIRKSQAGKYRALLKAINTDSIASDADLAALLRGTGVTFRTDVPEEGVKAGKEFDSAHSAVFIATSGKVDNAEDLKAIRNDVGYLATRKRDEVETWEDASFVYEKKGNVTTKIKK